jgi:putative endonuclease
VSRYGQLLGLAGEQAAAGYLESLGYTILEKNYRSRAFEIDLVAKHGQVICFVEVKTRSSTKKGMPREAVGHAKQQKIIMGASLYLKQHHLINQRARFDVVEIITQGPVPEFNLIQNAFSGI